tara:strand:- start:315 stop:1049 length:735 start_codon:yes stop_codon:yes gene_type:complete
MAPNIPGWLTKLAGTAKYLPLETRQKMLPGVVGTLHKSGLLSELTGDELSQSAVYMSQFLGGSGEPLELDISDKEWKALIRESSEPPMDKQKWTPSTNPEYSSKEGWEWKQISPYYKEEGFQGEQGEVSMSLYHILGGTTTLRRRKIDKDKYEYQIAEDFDVTRGTEGKDYSERSSGRSVPISVAKLIKTVFPEYVDDPSDNTSGEVWTSGKLKGAPVPIKSSYIHSTKTEDMLIDSMGEKGIF